MVTVYQAIYGDKFGSYSLLKTNMTDTEQAKRICNVTDTHDRPSSGNLSRPIIRAFPFLHFYIFIKSFPDSDTGVRRGRILSHVIIIEQINLHMLNDLRALFSYFLSSPKKDTEFNVINIDENMASIQPVNFESREAAAINGLLSHSDYDNTLVWIGEEGYLDFIICLWNQLNGCLRSKLHLGAGFSPQKVDPQILNILYVPEEYEAKWKTSNFYIIGKDDCDTLDSMSALLLAGYKEKSKPLGDFVKTFGIEPTMPEDYCYLEQVLNTYTNLSSDTDFKSLIVLCDLISKYSPNQAIAKNEKVNILEQVLLRIEVVSANEILALKNAAWHGFYNAEKVIGQKIVTWSENYLFDSKIDEKIIKIISSAFDPINTALWWKSAILEGIQNKLNIWQPTYAKFIWEWFKSNPALVSLLDTIIPNIVQIEKDFVNYCPNSKKELFESIKNFAEKRKWYILHGISVLQLYNVENCIKIQLGIDTNPENLEALQKMAELINDKEFVQLAVKIGESRLVTIASEIVGRSTILMGQLDAKSNIWRHIWLKSIRKNNGPWDGILNPNEVLFSLFEEILNGNEIDSDLLLALSNSDHNDLAVFVRRAEVWKILNEHIKSGFLKATAIGCVKLIDTGSFTIDDLEEDIKVSLINPEVIKKVIADKIISVATKIALFEKLPRLKENDFLLLLDDIKLSASESQRIGKLVYKNKWGNAAIAIARKISIKSDLKPALIECESLLSFFEKIMLFTWGHMSEPVSVEEWWQAFTEQCYEKYPRGPAEFSLWERAGGKKYDLFISGSGREVWIDALNKIKTKKIIIDINGLLEEMLKDFPNSEELKHLKESYNG